MCELFGISSKEKVLCNPYLKEFFSHGTEHPHGWGIAQFFGQRVSLEKEPVCSLKSGYLKERLTDEIRTDLLLAHIRLATKGGLEYKNTHPFVQTDRSGRTWTLEHNGTVFESEELSPYIHKQAGTTDSERILYYLIDRLDAGIKKKGGELSGEERFQILDEVVQTITPENKINLIICDGEILYVHTNYQKSLHIMEAEDTVMFSTQPLLQDEWEPLPLNTLLAYKDGEKLYEGTRHENEFLDSEEKMRFLFLDFAGM